MRLPVSALLCGFALAVPAQAQVVRPVEDASGVYCDESGEECAQINASRTLQDDRITVLANGMWDRIDVSGQTISVLDEADLRAIQGPDLTRALQRLPGVSLTRNGGLGSFTGLSVRGAKSEQVLVLVDGIRVNDVAGPAGGFDFGSVTMDSVERVELLRGSNSLVWGSDALGGVLHLATRLPDGLEASAEYGGDDQASGSVALGVEEHDFRAGLSASYVTREGFSSAASGSEKDGFEQLALTGRGEVSIASYWRAFANFRYAAGATEIDGFPPPDYTFADTLERQDMEQVSARAGVDFHDGSNNVSLSLAHAETRRDLVDEAFAQQSYYSTRGRSTRAELRGRLPLTDDLVLRGGGDWEWSDFTDGVSSAEADIASAHAMVQFGPGFMRWGGGYQFTAGLRYDHHDRFGGEWSLAANGMVELSQISRLRASYGEGFKAPSLFQLNSDFGNLLLGPERSRSYDIGVDLTGPIGGSLTLFRRDSSDLIDFTSCFGRTDGICTDRPFGTYDNIGRARSQGVEVEARAAIGTRLQAGFAYAYIESENRETGLDLARRPHHTGTFTLDWQALPETLSLGADLRLVSGSYDDAANLVRLDSHALLDLRMSWTASENIELYARVENAWDESYQSAAGYASQGRAAYLGARAKL